MVHLLLNICYLFSLDFVQGLISKHQHVIFCDVYQFQGTGKISPHSSYLNV